MALVNFKQSTEAKILSAPIADGTFYVSTDTNKLFLDISNKRVEISANTNTTYTLTKSGNTITLNASDGNKYNITDANTTYGDATTVASGLMSAADKAKLDGIAAQANKVVVDASLSDSSTNPVQNKVIKAALDGKAAATHGHGMAQISGLTEALAGKAPTSHTHTTVQVSGLDTALAGKANTAHNHDATNITSGVLNVDRVPSIPATKLTGIINQANLPSYVDDVLEFANKTAFPTKGESGKIYVDQATNKTYRWSGSGYVEISASLALGTTSSTAFRGDYGNVAYTHATAKGAAFGSGLYKITTNAQGHVTTATAVTKSDITALGIPGSDTNTNTTYELTKSGSTITLEGSDGSSTSVTDSNTVYTHPITPGNKHIPAGGSSGQILRWSADGTAAWGADNNTNTTYTLSKSGSTIKLTGSDGSSTTVTDSNTTYSAMTGATSSAAGSTGLVPAPAAGAATRYLRSDGTWQVPPDTNTTYTLSSFGITATAAELNKLDGVTATATELNYVDGVTSNIQTQLNGKAASSHTHSNYLTTSGTAAAATKLATACTFSLTGDVTGSASFNGTTNCSIAATLAANSVTANEIATGAVGLSELSSTVGTIAVQSATPTDSHVKLWIKV